MVLIDDPAATIGIGPGGWLVQVASAADFIGAYEHTGGSCSYVCGWCQPGQSFCHNGLTEENFPQCGQCLPHDAPDIGYQCAAVIAACNADDDNDSTGTTGAGMGLDETGAGATEVGEHDCTAWNPAAMVARDDDMVVVDATLVNAIVSYAGEPLSKCDDTRFRQRADGYFEVSRRSETGLLARMGLDPGDVVLSVDGFVLNDLDAVLVATGDLLLGGTLPSEVTLTIRRDHAVRVEHVHIQ